MMQSGTVKTTDARRLLLLLPLLLFVCVAVASPASGSVNATMRPAGSGGKSRQRATPAVGAVAAPAVEPVDAVVMKENDVATLQCNGAQVIAWYHVSTQRLLTNELTDDRGNPGKYVIADTTLNVTRVGRADVGIYACYDGRTRANYTVQLLMKPTFVKQLSQSLNMAEGEPLKLVCDTFGWPTPRVVWIRSNPITKFVQPLDANVTIADPRIVANGSLLTIIPASRADYMVYMCVSANSVGSSNSTTLVRVKGKLTALWPFIGIVIEVIILIVIIVVFEKKKAKQIAQKQALQAEQEKLLQVQQSKGKDDLRLRK